jgi:ABC-type nitrate/sulfonate/bicarbonate transport system substrate-binding protein
LLQRAGPQLRIGYVPILDSAPVVVAHELGFFAREGLATSLRRQPGWACVRDKMLYGAIEVASAPAGFLYAVNAGATPNVGRCLSAFVMSAQGNAITLSHKLHRRGLRRAEDFPAEVRARRSELITLGIVSQHSSHAHLLRGWLQRGGVDPDTDLRIVVLPPQQMVTSLATGHLDGFCAGEPWNTLAVDAGQGWVVAGSAELAPMHPEKVVLVHEDFAAQHHDEHMSLLRALQHACDYCADPANRPALAKLLARMVFLDIPEKLLVRSLSSPLAPVFAADQLHVPSPDKAGWVLAEMRRFGLLPVAVSDDDLLASFRLDLYERMTHTTTPARSSNA